MCSIIEISYIYNYIHRQLYYPRVYSSNGNPREGHVEVCLNGMWGGVCMKNWDTVDAEAVCSQLGFLASGMLGKYFVQLL